MMPSEIPRFIRTVRHLRPTQVAYRIWYSLRSRVPARFPWRHSIPQPSEDVSLVPVPLAVHPPRCANFDASAIQRGAFRFLNDEARFSTAVDWEAPGKGLLWRYNLHYFQYLFPREGLPPETAHDLVRQWVDRNPAGTPDAWDPFPTALRVVNWIKYLNCELEPGGLTRLMAGSLVQQMHHLERHLEYQLLGNHLFKNGKALVFGGLACRGADADRWLRKGVRILTRELSEQILPDGGHFERSPMYHSMIFEDCLDLFNVCRPSHSPECRALADALAGVLPGMLRFLVGMTHPDGEIALFNDAALGIERPPAVLASYFHRLMAAAAHGSEPREPGAAPPCRSDASRSPESGQRPWITASAGMTAGGSEGQPGEAFPSGARCWAFADSGYFVMAPADRDRLIVDCGAVGPDYQPGHSHCDTLSFELSLAGRRVIVDSGCLQYEDGELRQYNRGNSGHNTLSVDGCNQSEVWGAHRCGRRAKPLVAVLEERPDGELVFEGAHDGYRWLRGSPIHHRRIAWSRGTIRIEDRVEGRGVHDLELRLHIHPALRVEVGSGHAVISDGTGVLAEVQVGGSGALIRESGWYCPEFGKRKPCPVLKVVVEKATLPFHGGWVLNGLKHAPSLFDTLLPA